MYQYIILNEVAFTDKMDTLVGAQFQAQPTLIAILMRIGLTNAYPGYACFYRPAGSPVFDSQPDSARLPTDNAVC